MECLTIEAVRGASRSTQIDFNSDLPICLVFGENGTGKSTLVDAIDLVCNGKIGSLEHRKLGRGQRREGYLPSLGRDPADVRVELKIGQVHWNASLERGAAKLCATPNRPRALILRRPELLNFVDAEPAKQYERLAKYIAVDEIESSETALRDAVNRIDRQVSDAIRATEQARSALEKLWENEGRPGDGWESWAASEAKKEVTELTSTVEFGDDFLQLVSTFNSAAVTLANTDANVVTAAATVAQTETALAEARKGFAKATDELLRVLKDARDYFVADPGATACPVCETPKDPGPLTQRLDARIASLSLLDKHSQELSKANIAHGSAVSRQNQAAISFAQSARAVSSRAAVSQLQEIRNLSIDWSQFTQLQDESLSASDPLVITQARLFKPTSDLIAPAITPRVASARKTLGQLTAIRSHIEDIGTRSRESEELTELQQRAKETLRIVQERRKAFVDDVLSRASTEVNTLYSKVHPGEKIGDLRLYLDPNERGSLKFEGKFEDLSTIPPQVYYSEAHLDTLGVCVFLAIAKQFNSSDTIIVLDDVFTSADQQHLHRIIQMLQDTASEFNHLLITTHYRPWRDIYRYSRGPTSRVQLIELLSWSLSRGVSHTRTKLVVDELEEVLLREPLDQQAVASKAGILLEALLDHLTVLYACSVPRRGDDMYTLGELIDAIDSRLRRALTVTLAATPPDPELPRPLAPFLEAMGTMTWIRNQVGAHFRIDANLSDRDVRSFGEQVRDFALLLACPDCGELPKSAGTGVDRRCHCRRLSLQPAVRPQ